MTTDRLHCRDREWIEDEYLPKLWGKILYVGIADYTASYSSLIPSTCVWHTIDVDVAREDKTASKHFVGDFLEIEFKEKYDHISFYGLWGHGHAVTNDTNRIKKILEKADTMTNPSGTIMLGPNHNKNVFTKKQCHDIFRFLSGKGYKTLFEEEIGSNSIYWGQKYMLIVTSFDKNYFKWVEIYFESLAKTNPGCNVYVSGVNLKDEQVSQLESTDLHITVKNERIEFDGIQKRIDGNGPDAQWKVMMQCRVSKAAVEGARLCKDIMVVTNADMLFKKSLSDLYKEAQKHDIMLHFTDTHMSKGQIQNGVMVFNLKNPLVKAFLSDYNKMWDQEVYHYLDQIHLFDTYEKYKDKLNFGKLDSLYIDGKFNEDAFILSAHKGDRSQNYRRFLNEQTLI